MAYSIDRTTYDKAKAYPIDHGYDLRDIAVTSIVAHSTEGGIGQTFASAANYLYTSAKVSAHYLIGRDGYIVQYLDVVRYSAWHSGVAEAPFINQRSIGIECLHSRGEVWPNVQKDALAWLINDLATQYAIPARLIETHGQIAIPGPYQRKIDPTNWPHLDFRLFVDQALSPSPTTRIVHAGPFGAMARQDYMAAAAAAAYFAPGTPIEIDDFAKNSYRHAVSGIGFIAEGDLVLT